MNGTTRRTLPALILTAVVLTVAFAGGAVAAKMVTGKQIKNNTVTTQDIKNKSLKGADVQDGSLGEADLNSASKKKLNAPSVKGYEVVTETVTVPTASEATVYVPCTKGKLAMSGGADWDDVEFTLAIKESAPMKQIGNDPLYAPATPTVADAWKITAAHNVLGDRQLTAYVICVSPN